LPHAGLLQDRHWLPADAEEVRVWRHQPVLLPGRVAGGAGRVAVHQTRGVPLRPGGGRSAGRGLGPGGDEALHAGQLEAAGGHRPQATPQDPRGQEARGYPEPTAPQTQGEDPGVEIRREARPGAHPRGPGRAVQEGSERGRGGNARQHGGARRGRRGHGHDHRGTDRRQHSIPDHVGAGQRRGRQGQGLHDALQPDRGRVPRGEEAAEGGAAGVLPVQGAPHSD